MKPTIHAVLICDTIYKEPTTGKMSIMGVYHSIICPSLPIKLERMIVYLALSGVRSETHLTFHITGYNDEDLREVRIGEGKIDVKSDVGPNAVLELPVSLPNTVFETAGEYKLVFEWEGDTVGEHRFTVVERDVQ